MLALINEAFLVGRPHIPVDAGKIVGTSDAEPCTKVESLNLQAFRYASAHA